MNTGPAASETGAREGQVAPSPATIWDAALLHIRGQVSTPVFQTCFMPLRPGDQTPESFVLFVPSRFVKESIDPRYVPLITQAVAGAAGEILDVELLLDPTPVAPSHGLSVGNGHAGPARRGDSSPLNPRYTFDSYVIGASNRFAHAAALAVSETPAHAYNPLFIYGGVGLGKTHLLHAIGHYIQQIQPNAVVCYISSERFTNDFIDAVGDHGRIAGFKRRYRENDVLLVDDIQFLENKEATIEEFFHTFNTLHDAQRQLVLTSDRPPKQLGLEERVRSRFEWGLITDVQPPDLETRIAILRKKAALDGASLPDDVLAFIASRVESNIRELEGALIRVLAFASLDHRPVSLALAETVLKDLYPESGPASITSDLILAETARYFNLSVEELVSPNRNRPVANARQMAMYLCRELTDLSLPRIGQRFGGRDHSTVMHATTKIRGLMNEQRSTYNQIQELTTRIRTRAKAL
ncbi:MAG TPA: chromosomal replication initiator protein DnaA [Actinomycetota bacterium]|nr:chromosomal replication initiator protein DnaA [Actinomycetota bacterium]